MIKGKTFLLLAGIMILCASCHSKSDIRKNYSTLSGKKLKIIETHPVGMSLSTIELSSEGFDYNIDEIIEDSDPIREVLVADLDDNGYDEFYIIVVSAGSGSYGNVIGYASNKDKSLSMINFPSIVKDDMVFEGYSGHDDFSIIENKLVRTFTVDYYKDTSKSKMKKMRKIYYELYPGEAMWQLRIVRTENVP